MSEFVRRNICEGVNFVSVRDDRFKISRIGATLIVPLNKNDVSANALLCNVLTRSCRAYPDFTALNKKLDSLYGAALYSSVRKVGGYQTLSITAAGIDDKYSIDGSSVSSELASLLCSILFEPNIKDGRFSDEDVEQERRELLETLEAEYSDKRSYAIKRCVEIMCRDEVYSIGRFGTKGSIEAVTHKDIHNAWQKLLKHARIELIMLGNTPPDRAYESFKAFFEDKPRRAPVEFPAPVTPLEVKRVMETDDVTQSKLVMGFRCERPEESSDLIANILMSVIFGGTPTSKLFLNVREKQSLCYYCVSQADNNRGLMFVDCGVETENIEKTEKSVLEQLELLKSGCITDEELEAAKLALKNSFITTTDNLGAMQAYYNGTFLQKELISPLEAVALVDTVSRERIIELANKVQLDTVYTLAGN